MIVLVVTNMYPSVEYQTYGIFVQEMVSSLEHFEKVSCKVVFISERKKGLIRNTIKYLKLLMKVLKATLFSSYDVVNVHYIFPTGLIALPAFILRKKPLVITSHGGDVRLGKKNKLLKILTRYLLGK
ncbi:MAG: glycosyltransferase, partial [Candidatus Contubernalis sp.]|nr:glycosyltransferase [Candidatus Contubernalis sp.]